MVELNLSGKATYRELTLLSLKSKGHQIRIPAHFVGSTNNNLATGLSEFCKRIRMNWKCLSQQIA
jgi:hypothetical protein